jgi:hypothetical protein
MTGFSQGLAALLSLALAGVAHAQAPNQETPEEAQRMADSLFQGGFPIDDAKPESSIPSAAARDAAPLEFGVLLMELAERADRAAKRDDHLGAARYYKAVAQAVPTRSLTYAQLCREYEAAKLPEQALSACAQALRLSGVTFGDFEHYVHLVLAQPGELSAGRVHDLDRLLQHLGTTATDPVSLAQLRCDIGVRLQAEPRLRECSEVLRQRAPNAAKTLGYEWALALLRSDHSAAARVVERAKHSTLRPAAVQIMAEATEQLRPWRRAVALLRTHAGLASAAALMLVLAVFVSWWQLRSRARDRARTDASNRAGRAASPLNVHRISTEPKTVSGVRTT